MDSFRALALRKFFAKEAELLCEARRRKKTVDGRKEGGNGELRPKFNSLPSNARLLVNLPDFSSPDMPVDVELLTGTSFARTHAYRRAYRSPGARAIAAENGVELPEDEDVFNGFGLMPHA